MSTAVQKVQDNILSKPVGSVFPSGEMEMVKSPSPMVKSGLSLTSSRTADKFVVRLPDGMRDRVAQVARKHHRSMNSEVISTLSLHLQLIDMGYGQHLESLLKGDLSSEMLAPAPTSVPMRAGDPVTYNGALWIIESLEAKGNMLYANIIRENPATSMPDNTTVRYSALTPFAG